MPCISTGAPVDLQGNLSIHGWLQAIINFYLEQLLLYKVDNISFPQLLSLCVILIFCLSVHISLFIALNLHIALWVHISLCVQISLCLRARPYKQRACCLLELCNINSCAELAFSVELYTRSSTFILSNSLQATERRELLKAQQLAAILFSQINLKQPLLWAAPEFILQLWTARGS